jgi:hypothetical protein
MGSVQRYRQLTAIGVVALFTTLGALGLWVYGGANRQFVTQHRQIAEQKRAEAGLSDEQARQLIAWAEEYVNAVQRGDCNFVIAATIWMQDRLEYVRSHAADPAAEERAAREALCADIRNLPKDRRVITDGGAEDPALLTGLSRVDFVSVDPGREDLESPVAGRVWLRVRYPSAGEAPVDEIGRPIRTIRVGLTLTPDGHVVKAGVVGNMELDDESSVVYW